MSIGQSTLSNGTADATAGATDQKGAHSKETKGGQL